MLHALRSRGLMSAVYGVIIVGMIMVFVIQFNPSAGKKTAALTEECAARVAGWCITPKDHMAAYRILIPRGPGGELQTARAKQMGLHKIALDGLVEREQTVFFGADGRDAPETLRPAVQRVRVRRRESIRVALEDRVAVAFHPQRFERVALGIGRRGLRIHRATSGSRAMRAAIASNTAPPARSIHTAARVAAPLRRSDAAATM